MAHTDDHVSLSPDEVFADLIRAGDALDAAPLYPCPRCGKETKLHHTPKDSRICSNRACRARMKDPRVIEASRQMGLKLQPVVILCPECGAITKEHHDGARICVGATIVDGDTKAKGDRHVLPPGSFEDPRGVDRADDPESMTIDVDDVSEVTLDELTRKSDR